MRTLEMEGLTGLYIFIGAIVICGIIALVAFFIYRRMHPKLKENDREEKSEQDYAQEELDRILQPIEDDETAKQVSEYKEEDD